MEQEPVGSRQEDFFSIEKRLVWEPAYRFGTSPLEAGPGWYCSKQPQPKPGGFTRRERQRVMRSRTCKTQFFIAAGLALAGLTAVDRARADAVIDWNIITGQTIPFATRPGGSPGLDFAMVHLAIY